MLKAIFRVASVALISHSSFALAQFSNDTLPEAIEVLERSVATGNLNFVVAAVGNAEDRPGRTLPDFKMPKKPGRRLPITSFKLPQ